MNGIQPHPPSFLDTQKGSEKSATVSTRWTPTREQSPLDPAQRKTIKCNFYRLLPGPPCGPGVQVLPQREKKLDWANGLQRKEFSLPPPPKTFHPACKVRPGAAGSGMACRLSVAGVLGVRPPSRRPPIRKGGAFLDSSFGDERRIALRQADGDRETAHERRITPRQAAGHLPTKEVRPTAAGRKSSDESVCPLSSSHFRRCKTEERPRSTLRPLPALRLMAQTRDMIARAGKNQKAPSGKSSNLLFPDLTLAGPPAHRVYCNWEVFQTRNHISRYITFQRQS